MHRLTLTLPLAQAVVTYTKCLDQMQSGYLPEWKDKKGAFRRRSTSAAEG